MSVTPIIPLPVRWQVTDIDIESIAPHRGFAQGAYDVANANSTILVENPQEQTVRLVMPFPTERGSAGVRVVSTDVATQFKKEGPATQFVDLLKQLGSIPADQEPILKEVRAATKDFLVADVHLPAGSQVLRVYARQLLRPAEGNPKSFEAVFFAPLAGFVLAPSGQANMSVSLSFSPLWAAPGLQIGEPQIIPLPNVPGPSANTERYTVAEKQVFAWLWRNDPKVVVPYAYA